ncbi:hypothetical protein ACVCNR_24710 [Aquamicrobium terrae]
MHENWTLAELVAAGWNESDLQWERLTEAALSELAEGRTEPARQRFAEALRLARAEFATNDPRLAASLSNQAATQGTLSGRIEAAAAQAWTACDRWIDGMTAPRTARSSLFHLRMERLHRPAYEERWRVKARELLAEVRNGLGETGQLELIDPQEAVARLARWSQERPVTLSDPRKLMASVILLGFRRKGSAGEIAMETHFEADSLQ